MFMDRKIIEVLPWFLSKFDKKSDNENSTTTIPSIWLYATLQLPHSCTGAPKLKLGKDRGRGWFACNTTFALTVFFQKFAIYHVFVHL